MLIARLRVFEKRKWHYFARSCFLFRCPMIPIERVFIMVQTPDMPFTPAPCCSSRWMMIRHRIHGWDFSPLYQRSCSVAENNDE